MTSFTAYVASDLYQAGRRFDDGQPFIAECYYVLIENEAGRRFHHEAVFKGAARKVCEETGEYWFADLRQEAEAKAERLAARVNAALAVGIALDSSRWYEVDPAYGSDAYIAQGTEAKRAAQERAAG